MSRHSLIYGCMNLGGHDWKAETISDEVRQAAYKAIEAALENEIFKFDHADIYGHGKSETVFGDYLASQKVKRKSLYLQTKCGIRWQDGVPFYDFSPDYLKEQVARSLDRLRTDYIDCFLLHRPDLLANPEEVSSTLAELKKEGLIKGVGVSNFSPRLIDEYNLHLLGEVQVNQIPLSLLNSQAIDLEINWLEENHYAAPGLLSHARQNKYGIQAYGPLCQGLLEKDTPSPLKNGRDIIHAQQICKNLSNVYEVSVNQLLLAFLYALPFDIEPVIGTLSPKRIKDCAKAHLLALERPHFYQLLEAGREGYLP